MKIIAGLLAPDSGQVVVGQTVKMGYYAQELSLIHILMIVYSTVAGSVSVAALFVAGYVPGILWGIGVMALVAYFAKKKGSTV